MRRHHARCRSTARVTRRLLGDRDDDALWISNRGTRLSSHQIFKDVARVTKKCLGLSCAPHMFRDADATTVHARAPELASKINIALGKRPDMTHRHYVAPSPQATIDASKRAGAIFDRRRCFATKLKPRMNR
jgi:hypothetical protein